MLRTFNVLIFFLLVVGMASTLFITSCKHDPTATPDTTSPTPPDTTTTNDCDPDTVYFLNDILPLILSTCAKSGCHDISSQQGGVILTDYQNIINTGDVDAFNPGNSKLYEVITETDPDDFMPPSPNTPLSSQQINLIYTWIMQGALNNYCNSSNCDSINVTFSGTIMPMITTYCMGCHSGTNPSGGISLTNHSQVSANAQPGIWSTINHYNPWIPMPYNGPKLSQCKINQFKRWLDIGKPNN